VSQKSCKHDVIFVINAHCYSTALECGVTLCKPIISK
jgi:hypothetical protein